MSGQETRRKKNPIRQSIYGISQKKHRRREGHGQEAVIWEVKEVRTVHLSCPCSGADSQSKTNCLNTEARCRSAPSSLSHHCTENNKQQTHRLDPDRQHTLSTRTRQNHCLQSATNAGPFLCFFDLKTQKRLNNQCLLLNLNIIYIIVRHHWPTTDTEDDNPIIKYSYYYY